MSENPLNRSIRSGIKTAARVAQVARLIELMPTPQDFANRIAGDIIYMSSLVQKFMKDINSVLEGYSDIPFDYFNNQLYSISDSIQNTLNRANEYSKYVTENTLGLASQVTEIGAEIYDIPMDLTTETANMVSNFGVCVASTAAEIKGQRDVAENIRGNLDKFKDSGNSNRNPLVDATKTITDAQVKANDFIDKTTTGIGDDIRNGVQFIQNIINQLKETVDKMSKDIDNAFGNIISKDKITSNLDVMSGMNGDYHKAQASQAAGAVTEAASYVLENFSLGKFVTAFMGVATNATIVTLGLDKLPPINFDKMMGDFRGGINTDTLAGVDRTITMDDLVEYDPETFNNLQESYETYLKLHREEVLARKKNMFGVKMTEAQAHAIQTKNWYNGMSKEERKQIKSACNEIRRKRRQVTSAKNAENMKKNVIKELKKLQDECKMFASRLKAEWESMLQTYKDAVQQIKDFFHGDGPGDKYVDDLCLDINKNIEDIKRLCTSDMPTHIAGMATKAALPYCFGMAIPNYGHNIISFLVDLKVLLKFIMDLLKYIFNILNDIKKLAQLFLFGLRKLKDMIRQLLDMLGLGWLTNLVKDITDLFADKVNEACRTLESTLSPVYLKDLNMYPDMMGEVEKFVSEFEYGSHNPNPFGNTNVIYSPFMNEETYDAPIYNPDKMYRKLGLTYDKGYINGLLVMMGVNPINLEEGDEEHGWTYWISQKHEYLDPITGFPILTRHQKIMFDDKKIVKTLKERIDEIRENDATFIAAYKSPHFVKGSLSYNSDTKDLKDYEDIPVSINTECDPSNIDSWIYYHPDLNHYGYDITAKSFSKVTDKVNYGKIGDITDGVKVKYLNFMNNAAGNPGKNWMKKVIVKPFPLGEWKGVNINGDTTITANEAFYWFDIIPEYEDMYDMITPPNTPDFGDLFEGGDDTQDVDSGNDNEPVNGYGINLSVSTESGSRVSGTSQIVVDGVTNSESYIINGMSFDRLKTWEMVSTDVDTFDMKCVGNKTGGNGSSILTEWNLENAEYHYDIAGNEYVLTSGEQHSETGKVELVYGTDTLTVTNMNIRYDKGSDSIYLDGVVNTTLTGDYHAGGKISVIDGIIKIVSDGNDIYIHKSNMYVIKDGHMVVYNGNSANIVSLRGCSPVVKGNVVKGNVSVMFADSESESPDYVPDELTNTDSSGTGGGDTGDVNVRTYSVDYVVDSKTADNVSGYVEFTVDGREYEDERNKHGKNLEVTKTWNYIPAIPERFDVRFIASMRTGNPKEDRITSTWELVNGVYDFVSGDRTYSITKGIRYSYVPEGVNGSFDVTDGILKEYGVEDADTVLLTDCRILDTDKDKGVKFVGHVSFDGDNLEEENEKDDSVSGEILDRSVNGSVVRIFIDEDGVKKEKYVFVRNRIVKDSDWVVVNGKYYQVFLPKKKN